MPVTVPSLTLDDLGRFPADGNRYELLVGMLLVSPGPAMRHQVVSQRLAALLGEFLRPWPEYLVASPGAVIRPPDTRLEPDIAVFQSPGPGRDWDAVTEYLLVVETSSPSTMIYDRDFKRPAYLDFGVEEVWRVDVAAETVRVSRRAARAELLHETEVSWSPARVGRSCRVPIAPLFEGL